MLESVKKSLGWSCFCVDCMYSVTSVWFLNIQSPQHFMTFTMLLLSWNERTKNDQHQIFLTFTSHYKNGVVLQYNSPLLEKGFMNPFSTQWQLFLQIAASFHVAEQESFYKTDMNPSVRFDFMGRPACSYSCSLSMWEDDKPSFSIKEGWEGSTETEISTHKCRTTLENSIINWKVVCFTLDSFMNTLESLGFHIMKVQFQEVIFSGINGR